MKRELDITSPRKFNSSLKKSIFDRFGINVLIEIINPYNFQNCNVRVIAVKNSIISNDVRLLVFDASGFERKLLCYVVI